MPCHGLRSPGRSNPFPRILVVSVMTGGILERTETDVSAALARARGGDADAFETVYRLHAGQVFALCRRMARDHAEAEDWAQDAWVRAWERLRTFRGEARFATWLHRLTVNLILDERRRDDRWKGRLVSASDDGRSSVEATRDAPPGVRLDLERAVETLPDGARTIFLLHDVEGYRQREIARRLGIAVGTVKSQLHRARKLLKEVLDR